MNFESIDEELYKIGRELFNLKVKIQETQDPVQLTQLHEQVRVLKKQYSKLAVEKAIFERQNFNMEGNDKNDQHKRK